MAGEFRNGTVGFSLPKLKAKEKEYYDGRYLKKATFTNQYNGTLVNVETALPESLKTKLAKWMSFFKRDNSYQDGEQFYRSLQQLMEDFQFACRRREDELQYHEEMLDRDYRKKAR